jgi:hypothetical protein
MCQSSATGSPASGSVSAGKKLTFAGVQYQEPVPSGSGSCASSTTNGTAVITWADGTYTVLSYSTTGATAAVVLNGTVINSVALTAPGHPNKVITTNRYAGQTFAGLVFFQPPDPTQCNSTAGVAAATIKGLTGLGSAM